MSVISIDIDAQRAFSELCPKELPVAGAMEIVAELNAQAELADPRWCYSSIWNDSNEFNDR